MSFFYIALLSQTKSTQPYQGSFRYLKHATQTTIFWFSFLPPSSNHIVNTTINYFWKIQSNETIPPTTMLISCHKRLIKD